MLLGIVGFNVPLNNRSFQGRFYRSLDSRGKIRRNLVVWRLILQELVAYGTSSFNCQPVLLLPAGFVNESDKNDWETRGQSNLTKSASRGAHSPVRGHPRGSKVVVVPLNSWGRVSY